MTVRLTADAVHVWVLPLDRPALDPERFRPVLSAEERLRAEKFLRADDRRRYVTTRGVLRHLLGSYLAALPTDLRFCKNEFGKPQLADPPAPLRFNVSHSGDIGIIGFALGREIGVDVEHRRPGLAREPIAERFFSPAEVRQLRSLTADQQEAAFFACWTRKEAYVKAIGRGMGLALDQFEVTLGPDDPVRLVADGIHPAQSGRWQLFSVETAPEYTAAVAVEGRGLNLAQFVFPDESLPPVRSKEVQ